MIKQLPEALRPIPRSKEEAEAAIRCLIDNEILWHFEDDAVDCLHETNLVLSRADAEHLNDLRDALYGFDWGELECPIGYALERLEMEDA